MTRSEEELRVGTAERERGRVRLRKHVVTENVQQTVPVRREEVRVEREPITGENIDDAMSGPEISEDEHEVVLHEEEPVVEKRTVAKERVRLGTETHEDEREVSEEIRKEQIDVDDSPAPLTGHPSPSTSSLPDNSTKEENRMPEDINQPAPRAGVDGAITAARRRTPPRSPATRRTQPCRRRARRKRSSVSS